MPDIRIDDDDDIEEIIRKLNKLLFIHGLRLVYGADGEGWVEVVLLG